MGAALELNLDTPQQGLLLCRIAWSPASDKHQRHAGAGLILKEKGLGFRGLGV